MKERKEEREKGLRKNGGDLGGSLTDRKWPKRAEERERRGGEGIGEEKEQHSPEL